MTWRPWIVLIGVCAVTPACFSPARGFCAAAAECDEDSVSIPFGFDAVGESDDSIEVCVQDNEGFVRALRANEEPECLDAANAWDRYMACVSQQFAEGEDCDPFRNPALGENPCDAELDDFADALNEANGDCSSGEE
jgi:hypothetical protein